MKRVLQAFCSLEISGGVQSVVMNTFRQIDRTKVQFDFAVYQDPKENSYRDEITENGGQVFKVHNPGEIGLIGFYKEFYKLLSSHKYDAVHAHNIHHNGLILLAAMNAGVPIRISHCHQSFDERNTSFPRKALVKALEIVNNYAATRRVACSDLAGQYLYGKRKFQFLPNAIDISRYTGLNDKTTLRKQYGISEDTRVLIHIGRYCVQKNQFFLIDIMKSIKEENQDYLLLMIGDGALKESFMDAVKENGLDDKIKCLGIRKDVPELLKLSDIMLLPSIYEGLPVVAVEAQAAGCYSILSDEITRQSDLKLGLVDFEKIDDPIRWKNRIINFKEKSAADNTILLKSMKRQRFDTETNLNAWYKLYGVNGE